MGAINDVAQVTNLAEAKARKIAEIRNIADRTGMEGVSIFGCLEPLMVFHMAVTPSDVSLLQQANQVAKVEADMAGIPAGDPARTAEIKEKWYENGEEKTRLHEAVPEAVHDAVLVQAIMHAGEIYRKQERLIQDIQDAKTIDEVRAVSWNAKNTEVN